MDGRPPARRGQNPAYRPARPHGTASVAEPRTPGRAARQWSAEVEARELAAGGDARLGEDVAQVEGDGAGRDPAHLGHLLVAPALADELRDPELGRGEVDQR